MISGCTQQMQMFTDVHSISRWRWVTNVTSKQKDWQISTDFRGALPAILASRIIGRYLQILQAFPLPYLPLDVYCPSHATFQQGCSEANPPTATATKLAKKSCACDFGLDRCLAKLDRSSASWIGNQGQDVAKE